MAHQKRRARKRCPGALRRILSGLKSLLRPTGQMGWWFQKLQAIQPKYVTQDTSCFQENMGIAAPEPQGPHLRRSMLVDAAALRNSNKSASSSQAKSARNIPKNRPFTVVIFQRWQSEANEKVQEWLPGAFLWCQFSISMGVSGSTALRLKHPLRLVQCQKGPLQRVGSECHSRAGGGSAIRSVTGQWKWRLAHMVDLGASCPQDIINNWMDKGSFAWAQGLQFANFHIQPSNSVGRSSILSVLSFFLEGPTAFTICRIRTHQPIPADPPVVQRPLDRDRSSAPDWDLDTWWDIFVDFKPIRISIVKGLSGSSVALLLLYWYYPMLIHHNISRLGVSRSSFG